MATRFGDRAEAGAWVAEVAQLAGDWFVERLRAAAEADPGDRERPEGVRA